MTLQLSMTLEKKHQRDRVLDMLKARDEVCSTEFLMAYMPRFGGRIHELRKDGYIITTKPCRDQKHGHETRQFAYVLESSPTSLLELSEPCRPGTAPISVISPGQIAPPKADRSQGPSCERMARPPSAGDCPAAVPGNSADEPAGANRTSQFVVDLGNGARSALAGLRKDGC